MKNGNNHKFHKYISIERVKLEICIFFTVWKKYSILLYNDLSQTIIIDYNKIPIKSVSINLFAFHMRLVLYSSVG